MFLQILFNNYFLISYILTLEKCFNKNIKLIKFDSNSTDEEVDSFFSSL